MTKWIVGLLFVVLAAILIWKFFPTKALERKVEREIIKEKVGELKPLTEDEFKKAQEELKQLKSIKSYQEAVAVAALQRKQMFLYFGASWCRPCREMKSRTLVDPQVKNKLTEYVVYFVDADQDKSTTNKYGVRSLPTYMVVTADERVVKQASGYQNPKAFLDWLTSR